MNYVDPSGHFPILAMLGAMLIGGLIAGSINAGISAVNGNSFEDAGLSFLSGFVSGACLGGTMFLGGIASVGVIGNVAGLISAGALGAIGDVGSYYINSFTTNSEKLSSNGFIEHTIQGIEEGLVTYGFGYLSGKFHYYDKFAQGASKSYNMLDLHNSLFNDIGKGFFNKLLYGTEFLIGPLSKSLYFGTGAFISRWIIDKIL